MGHSTTLVQTAQLSHAITTVFQDFVKFCTFVCPFSEKSKSCHWEVFCKKDILRNFAKFTRNHLCQRLFLSKVGGLGHRHSLCHRYFPVNFVKFLRTPIFIEQLWWLLLKIAPMPLLSRIGPDYDLITSPCFGFNIKSYF